MKKLNFEDKLSLLIQLKRKRITYTMLAEHLNVSVSWVSQHFADKAQMGSDMEQQMINYINNYKAI